MKQGKTILGVLAGLAAGALLGVLFAPRKGKETRQKIADEAKDAFGKMKDKMNNAENDFSQKSDSAI